VLAPAGPEDHEALDVSTTRKRCTRGHRGSDAVQHKNGMQDFERSTSRRPSTRHKSLRSTAEVMAIADVSEEELKMCHVTCGVGGVVPLQQAVRRCLRDVVRRYSGILSMDALRECCQQAVELEDRFFFGAAPRVPLHQGSPLSAMIHFMSLRGHEDVFRGCGHSTTQKPRTGFVPNSVLVVA
jgi:hypothetical protein